MKYGRLDKITGELKVFSCKTDLAFDIGISTKTISRWQQSGNIKEYKDYIISFDVRFIKAKQKANNQHFSRL